MAGLNVLFITVDQWRGECLSSLAHPVVQTPNLDRLAASGVHFTQHFAQAAPCGPSRASIYTGMYLMNHRAVLNGTPLDARFTNIALETRRHGYQPALFGYTDTSIDPRTVDTDDPRLRSYEGVLPGFDPVCHNPEGDPQPWLQSLAKNGYDLPDDWRQFTDKPAQNTRHTAQYADAHSEPAFITDSFLDWLGDRGRELWFAHLSYLRPHPPFLAPPEYAGMYDPAAVPAPVRAPTREQEAAQHALLARMIDHPFIAAPDGRELQEVRATYFALMTQVDHHLGRIFDRLDETGAVDDTVVVITSDHGEMLGDHYVMHKLGWFDASYHVPCIIRVPGSSYDTARGTRVDAFTESVDVMPTVLDVLGLEVPLQCDGRPLTGWLQGNIPHDWRNEVHFEFDFREPADRRTERAFDVTMDECSLAVLRDRHGKYVQFGGFPRFESIYFDLDADPDQVVNRATDPQYAATVLDYAQRMLAWRMRHAERTLTGTKITGQGPIAYRAPRRLENLRHVRLTAHSRSLRPVVDAATFFGLERVGESTRFRMTVVPGLISGTGALFGGCGLGAAIEVMEQCTGRPCVWATAQYLSYARPPSVLELDVIEVVRGHQISQARVIAHVGDEEILTVVAALGTRTSQFEGQWAVRPQVPPPEQCGPRELMAHHEGTIASRLDMRLASARLPDEFPGPPGSGTSALWVRMPDILEMSSAALAIVGDYVPFGIGQALGQRAGGNSLDNTLRIANRAPTEWVLADIRVQAVHDGFGHGLVHLWGEDGTLLGTASQSTIVRGWRGDHEPPEQQEVR